MRLFVAAWPPADVVAGLARADRPASKLVRWTTPDQWHVTLRFLGEVEDGSAITDRLAEAHLGPPVTARLGPTSVILGSSVVCLPVTGLDSLAANVIAATADVGRPPDRRRFHGHVTLARARGGAGRGALRHLPALCLDASWTVDRVAVVASTLGGEGSRYQAVGTVALSGS